MIRKRKPVRLAVLAAALLLALLSLADVRAAIAQQLGAGMDRTGTVGIQNDAERRIFFGLLCTCGCPRETLGTCTCGFAHQRRDELRAAMAEGKTPEVIYADYVQRFGTQALAVPPNDGGQRALYLMPLGAILLGAVLVGVMLRKWRRKSDAEDALKPAAPTKRDAYDDKLDDELRALDDE